MTRFSCLTYLVHEESWCPTVSYDWVNGGSACIIFRHTFFLAWYGLRCIGRVSAILGNVYEINCNTILINDTMIPYMAQPCFPLNSQVLAILFPFATTPAMPHYYLVSQSHGQSNPWHYHLWPHWQNLICSTPTLPQSFAWFRLCRSSKDIVPG